MIQRAGQETPTLVSANRSAVKRRMVGGAAANLADKVALLGVQLVAIPLLSHYWGAEGYGIWLMLMTVPTYIALSDFGLWTAAGVAITQRVAAGDHDGALEVFQSAWSLVLGALVVVGLIAFGLVSLGLFSQLLDDPELTVAVALVALYGIAILQMTSLSIVYRATHRFTHAALTSTAVTLLEGAALTVAVSAGAGYATAMAAVLIVRAAGCGAMYLALVRFEPWLRLGTGKATIETVRRLSRPSMAAFIVMVANSIAIQGMVLALGWIAGPSNVAVFSAVRFITRIPLQFSGLIVRTSIPELTRAQSASDGELERRLTRMNVLSAIVPTLPLVPILLFAGPPLLEVASAGHLRAEWWLFGLLSTSTALTSIWQAMASPLIASNRQASFAYVYAAVSVIAVACAFLPVASPIAMAAAAMLASELFTTLHLLRVNRTIRTN